MFSFSKEITLCRSRGPCGLLSLCFRDPTGSSRGSMQELRSLASCSCSILSSSPSEWTVTAVVVGVRAKHGAEAILHLGDIYKPPTESFTMRAPELAFSRNPCDGLPPWPVPGFFRMPVINTRLPPPCLFTRLSCLRQTRPGPGRGADCRLVTDSHSNPKTVQLAPPGTAHPLRSIQAYQDVARSHDSPSGC